jgi:type IV pilus assembly protein PilY1
MKKISNVLIVVFLMSALYGISKVYAVEPAMPTMAEYSSSPIFTVATAPPLVMLVMGRDHKLYYEAYNDASDLNGDGKLDVGYNPDINYYGYFDSYKCYVYNNNRFEPSSVTTDKTCSNKWSGDFLNYVTMSRMDTMRKVLYGGYRSTDEPTVTVLERSFIPQDAHSWGKEYESIDRDGYDIRKYTTLKLPEPHTRHLFANTTLGNDISVYPPLMRVLQNSKFRIWNWVAKERPVAGSTCQDGSSCTYAAQTLRPSHPANAEQFQALVNKWAVEDQLCGSGSISNGNINTTGSNNNPFAGSSGCRSDHEYYLTIIRGQIYAESEGNYLFATNGDDAVEFRVNDKVVSYWYGGHGRRAESTPDEIADEIHKQSSGHNGSVFLSKGWHSFEFRHEELTGGDNYQLLWKVPVPGSSWEIVPATELRHSDVNSNDSPIITTYSTEREIPASTMDDYIVRVKVETDATCGLNCRQYGGESGPYKPVGLLQKNGETDKMYFGLMTGSYAKNMSGGVLRKNVGSIKDEINLDTGQFNTIVNGTPVNGIIQTINKLRIYDFKYPSDGKEYEYNGGWLVDKPMPLETNKKFPDWGNPIAEMMYETLRYFAKKQDPTPDYDYSGITPDSILGLPKPVWFDPFVQPDDNNLDQVLYCAKPIMLVISDINPSYDSDQLPGSAIAFAASGWSSGQALGAGTLNVQDRLNAISDDIDGLHFIGQVGSTFDSSCSPKGVDGLGNVRGLCPEEPTKQGGYYAGAVSHYGRNTDLRPDVDFPGHQKVSTYTVALSSPLPEIKIPVGDQTVTLVPFGKTVVAGGLNASAGAFQPTCTIVDFFVEEIAEDKSYGKFRINFEDVEQGADHDMDVIVLYEYWVQEDNTIKIKLTKEYQAAGYVLHLGYIISGTTKDGIYLEVASKPGSDIAYFLDTPMDRDEPGRGHSTMLLSQGVSGDGTVYSRERTFTPSNEPAATLLKDPLWYAAKWGGDAEDREWDKDDDGVPDTYFYVTNPLQLEKELNRAFASILEKASSGTSASVLATTSRGEGNVLQAFFRPTIPDHDEVRWLGYLQNLWVDSKGNIRENTSGANSDGSYSLNVYEDKILLFESDENGDTWVEKYNVSENPFPDIYNTAYESKVRINESSIKPIWEAGEKLLQRSAAERKIFTFIGDTDNALSEPEAFGTGNVVAFNYEGDADNLELIKPYFGVLCAVDVDNESCEYNYLGENADKRAENLMKYIRGEDIEKLRPRTIRDENKNPIGVWKLGDIINSSPTAVSRPPNKYHLIYGDTTYQSYYLAKRDRETVVFVGANDGMLHAFTSWKYDLQNRRYTKPSGTVEDIGDEIWAYIPQSLLPHLKWLPDPDYAHVYYVDQMPLVVDAKIGEVSGESTKEWRTILIGGLRMGGKTIDVYGDFGNEKENKKFHPTYFCIDITDPRNPALLWERAYDKMGFSFSVPTIIRNSNESEDNWYLVFGSGPDDYNGKSNQKGYLFVVDLATGNPVDNADNVDWVFEGNDLAFFASPTAMDKDLTATAHGFSHDYVYVSESYLDNGTWKGKIYRGDISGTPSSWQFHPVFSIDAPITASLALSVDKINNTWIFGGTGRYIEQNDKTTTDDQFLFGFKDPRYNPGKIGYENSELSIANLYSVDHLLVTTDKQVLDSNNNDPATETPTWRHLLGKTDIDRSDPNNIQHNNGWYRELPHPRERCITKPSVIGGLSLMPTFVPNDDICGFGGDSYFYSLYYKTGTAFNKSTFKNEGTIEVEGKDYEIVLDKISIGHGMPASHLGIHTGEQDGATALIQLGTGGIIKIDLDTAINIRSGILNWKEK